jgi:hypothetical protein
MITVENKVTVGNIITILTLIITCLGMIFTYKGMIDSHSEKLKVLEENQKTLENRITLLEKSFDAHQANVKLFNDKLNRTNDYLELLLQKEKISYVK